MRVSASAFLALLVCATVVAENAAGVRLTGSERQLAEVVAELKSQGYAITLSGERLGELPVRGRTSYDSIQQAVRDLLRGYSYVLNETGPREYSLLVVPAGNGVPIPPPAKRAPVFSPELIGKAGTAPATDGKAADAAAITYREEVRVGPGGFPEIRRYPERHGATAVEPALRVGPGGFLELVRPKPGDAASGAAAKP